MKRIDSRTNALYRCWKNLSNAKGIRDEGAILIAGRKLVPEFLASPAFRPRHLIVSDPSHVEMLKFKKNLDVIWLAKDLFDEIDAAGTHFPILVVDAPQIIRAPLERPPQGLEVVLSMSNPLNLGAALRSCEAFQASQVILLKECAHPFLPKVLRSSSGSSLRVKLGHGPSIHDLNVKESEFISALEITGENLKHARLDKNLRLLIGEEGQGVPRDLKFKTSYSISIKPGMDSLNAGVAVGIALYTYRSQHSPEEE